MSNAGADIKVVRDRSNADVEGSVLDQAHTLAFQLRDIGEQFVVPP